MSEMEQIKQIDASENKYGSIVSSLIFHHSSDPILLVKWNFSGEKKILRSNEKTSQLLGYSEEELAKLDFESLFLNSEFCCNISRLLKINLKTPFMRSHLKTKNGTSIQVEIIFELKNCADEEVVLVFVKEIESKISTIKKKVNKRLLLDSLTQPLILIDTVGNILECNSIAAKNLHNSEWIDLIGKNLFELLPPQISNNRWKRVKEVIEKKSAVDFIDERNGVTYNNHYYPIINNDGTLDKIAILADDVTTLDNLRKSLYLTQFSVEKSGIAIIWLDDKGKITYVNEFACEKFGYTQTELLQLHVWDIYPMETEKQVNLINQRMKETGFYKNELIAKRKDGTSFPAYITVNFLEIEEKPHYFAYLIDLSEKREYQWELNKLYYAIEQNPISISITDPDAIIEYVNPKYCELSGYSYEECIGKREGFLKSGEKPKIEYDEMWNHLKNRKVWRGILHNKNKNGQSYWEKVTISSILDHHGKIKHYLALKENITENKILQEKLYQSQKMEALGRLAGGVAHDFNNLLTIIMGYAQILESEKNNPYLSEIMEIIKTTDKAAALTGQLLAFSKRQILQPKLLDLNKIIQQMYSMLRRTFPSYIGLHFELSECALPVIIDKTQFEQVILNLTFNAKEAILPKGKGYIRVSSQMVEMDNESGSTQMYAQISIEDNGIGMDDTTQKSVFEPFFTTKLKGTGLGLSTVYGIVSQSNGFVEIESEIGKGTTFKTHFPIQFEKVEPNPLNISDMDSLSGEETILLIEDDKDVRKILTLLLKKSGYTVIEARNGIEGINLFENNQNRIDLIISDLVMPEMGGVEAMEKIRQIDPNIKYIFISGYTGEQQGILGRDEIIITKPINRMKFLEIIRNALSSVSNNSLNESGKMNI